MLPAPQLGRLRRRLRISVGGVRARDEARIAAERRLSDANGSRPAANRKRDRDGVRQESRNGEQPQNRLRGRLAADVEGRTA